MSTIDCLLHVHSSFSYDSRTDLADIARVARREDIRCVLMSEHNNFMDEQQMAALVSRCRELSDSELLILPGLELAFDQNRVHLLAFGVERYISSSGPECTFRSLVDEVHAAGGLAVLAHPSHRDAIRRLVPEDLDALDGIEIWNVKDGNRFVPSTVDLDILAATRGRAPHFWGFGGLDWHHLNRFTRLVARLETPELNGAAVLYSLRAGAFELHGPYASVRADGVTSASKRRAYALTSGTLSHARRVGYRWQSALERRGFRTPQAISAVVRRFL